MSNPSNKFNSMTAYLYDVSFEVRENQYLEICLDCLNQQHPWQALRTSQDTLDSWLKRTTKRNNAADKKFDTIKLQLFILSTADQRMTIYSQLNEVVEQLKPLRSEIRSLDNTLSRLKRINHNQRKMLKQLKVNLLSARGQEEQLKVAQRIEEIEWDLMSLWQRCIGAELDKLKLLDQSLEHKQYAITLLDQQLDSHCHSVSS